MIVGNEQHPFVVTRPDGFIGVELEVCGQLTPAEARTWARELVREAARAERELRKRWPKKIAKLTYSEDREDYSWFVAGKPVPGYGPSACDVGAKVRDWLLARKVTHVDCRSFPDKTESPECPAGKIYTRNDFLCWWRRIEKGV